MPPHPYWPPEEERAIGRALARSEHAVTSLAEVSLLRKNGERFPALLRPTWITDLRMPELSGLELTQRVRALRPDLPVILVTAHAEGIPQVGAPPDFQAVLSKPFRYSELVRVVQDCLAERADLGARSAM